MENSIIYSLDNINDAVKLISNLLAKYNIFTFTGDIGAGKTTLIKKILQANNVTDLITSPTFNLLNIYNNKFYHFDLYRLKTSNDFYSQGFHELLQDKDINLFIEWPEIILDIPEIKNQNTCNINIEYIDPDTRKLTYKCS